jgi:hypothetical protein
MSGSTWHDNEDDAMILPGCVSPSIDDTFLKPKTYKKGSQNSTTEENKDTHQPNTTRDSSSTTLNISPSSFTSSRHRHSCHHTQNCHLETMSDTASALPPFEFYTQINHCRLILQTLTGDAQEIRHATMEHCLQYNLFL